jgi:hypothetical protein
VSVVSDCYGQLPVGNGQVRPHSADGTSRGGAFPWPYAFSFRASRQSGAPGALRPLATFLEPQEAQRIVHVGPGELPTYHAPAPKSAQESSFAYQIAFAHQIGGLPTKYL